MDEGKLAEFMGRLVSDMGGAAMVASIIVGDELGLYQAMADGRAVTAAERAAATGCHPRLVSKWLNAQAASGYVELDGDGYRVPRSRHSPWRSRTHRCAWPVVRAFWPRCSWTRTSRLLRCVATVPCRGVSTTPACSTGPSGSSVPATRPTSCPPGFLRSTASPTSPPPGRVWPMSVAATARRRC